MLNPKVCIVIPARYESSRFYGKPLAKIKSRPMIHWVWDACCSALDQVDVFVATDSNLIADYCLKNYINYVMTKKTCMTGTDRVFEASKTLEDYDYYVNVQGDEPLVNPTDILSVIEVAIKNNYSVTNAFSDVVSLDEYYSNAVPKVVTDNNDKLIYMSRAAIPALKTGKKVDLSSLKKQICIYAIKKDALKDFGTVTQKTPLEKSEDIEILRFIELGFSIHMTKTKFNTMIDYMKDYLNKNDPYIYTFKNNKFDLNKCDNNIQTFFANNIPAKKNRDITFTNIGQSCFINGVTQSVILMNPYLEQIILQYKKAVNLNIANPDKDELIAFLTKIYKYNDSHNPFNTQEYASIKFKLYGQNIYKNKQEDSREYLNKLFQDHYYYIYIYDNNHNYNNLFLSICIPNLYGDKYMILGDSNNNVTNLYLL